MENYICYLCMWIYFHIFAAQIHCSTTLNSRKNMNERERLEKIIATLGINAKQFAQEVGIQAGTISNIMGGRNKPSLEVLQKVLNCYRTISSDWLILGIGSMYRPTNETPNLTLFDNTKEEPALAAPKEEPTKTAPNTTTSPTATNTNATPIQIPIASKQIDHITVYYTDNTYETFTH